MDCNLESEISRKIIQSAEIFETELRVRKISKSEILFEDRFNSSQDESDCGFNSLQRISAALSSISISYAAA